MNFSIPTLEGYFGGKGSSGVHQQIINIIPPHDTFVVMIITCSVIVVSIIESEKEKAVPCETTLPAN